MLSPATNFERFLQPNTHGIRLAQQPNPGEPYRKIEAKYCKIKVYPRPTTKQLDAV